MGRVDLFTNRTEQENTSLGPSIRRCCHESQNLYWFHRKTQRYGDSLSAGIRELEPSPPQKKYKCEAAIIGLEPMVREWGKAPWSWNTFGFCTFTKSCKFAHFKKIRYAKNQTQFVLSFQKMMSRPQYVTYYCTVMKSNRLVYFG